MEGYVDVRVDRSSALGNPTDPFRMGRSGANEALRDRVCDAYEELVQSPLTADVDAIARRHKVPLDREFWSRVSVCGKGRVESSPGPSGSRMTLPSDEETDKATMAAQIP